MSDGSINGSTNFIERWARIDPSVKLIILTRNFGHQSAISAGLSFASGTCVGIMDADLQDEPEVLLEMYRVLLVEKVDVVTPCEPAGAKQGLNGFSISFFTGFIFSSPIALYRSTVGTFA